MIQQQQSDNTAGTVDQEPEQPMTAARCSSIMIHTGSVAWKDVVAESTTAHVDGWPSTVLGLLTQMELFRGNLRLWHQVRTRKTDRPWRPREP